MHNWRLWKHVMCTNEGYRNASCAHMKAIETCHVHTFLFQLCKESDSPISTKQTTKSYLSSLNTTRLWKSRFWIWKQTYVAGLYRWMTVYPSWYIQTTMTAKEIIAYLTASEVLLYQAYVTLAILAILVLLLQRSFYIIWLCNLWSFIVADECYFRNSSCAIN